MVISLVYHIFFGMNIQDYQHMSIGVAEHTYQEDVCIYIYTCVGYNYPSICTMRGLEQAGLDI
jgi:hypothetical protein